MSLYDENECVVNVDNETWRPGIQFLETHLRTKKSAPKSADRLKSSQLAPVVDLHNRRKNNSKLKILDTSLALETSSGHRLRFKGSIHDWGLNDEYNPIQPSEYFKVKKELNRWRDKEKKRRVSARLDMESATKPIRMEATPRVIIPPSSNSSHQGFKNFLSNYGYDSDDASDDEKELGPPPPLPSVNESPKEFVRPTGLLSPPEASRDLQHIQLPLPSVQAHIGLLPHPTVQPLPPKGLLPLPAHVQPSLDLPLYPISTALKPQFVPASILPTPTVPPKSQYPSEIVAAKIMAKYGFKEGHGLGKDEQGMSTALQVQRTSRNCGRILHEKDLMPPPPPKLGTPIERNEEQSMVEMLKNPSKVVMLSNMVGPGEVDELLEDEIREECNAKYGEVLNVQIFEDQNLPDEEAVSVFVEFSRTEIAIKALVDLNGRYFGGRMVKAKFFYYR